MRSLQPLAGHTQEDLFVPQTAHIGTREQFRRGQRALAVYEAMNTTGKVSGLHPGWLIVTR